MVGDARVAAGLLIRVHRSTAQPGTMRAATFEMEVRPTQLVVALEHIDTEALPPILPASGPPPQLRGQFVTEDRVG